MSNKIPQHVQIKPGRTCVRLRISPASLPGVETIHFWYLIPSNPPKSSGLIWDGDGTSNTGSPSVIVLWRCATVHQCTGERSASLWAGAKALWTLSSTCYCSEVQHYKAPQRRQMRPSPLWTPIQLDCFFVCLFHFGHTVPSQELICGLLQVTVWRWQTCPASPQPPQPSPEPPPPTPPPPPLPSLRLRGVCYPRCPRSYWRSDAANLTF